MKTRQQGLALLVVLAIVSLITVFAAGAVSMTLSAARDTRSALATRQAQWQVESALVRLAQLTQDADSKRHPSRESNLVTIEVMGQPVEMRFDTDAQRVDLNIGDPALIGAVLLARGVPRDDMLEVVRVWRGAAAAASLADSTAVLPASVLDNSVRPYRWHSVSEALRGLVAAELPADVVTQVRCLRDAWTVQSFTVDVDRNAAVPPVAEGLRWAASQQWLGRNWTAPTSSGGETPWLGPPMSLDIKVSDASPVQQIGLRLTGARNQPLAVFWRGRVDGDDARVDLASCQKSS